MNNLKNFGVKHLYDPESLKQIHNFEELYNRKPKERAPKKKFMVPHNNQIDFYQRNGTQKFMEVTLNRYGITPKSNIGYGKPSIELNKQKDLSCFKQSQKKKMSRPNSSVMADSLQYSGVNFRSDNITEKPSQLDPNKPKPIVIRQKNPRITREQKLFVANVKEYQANRHKNVYASQIAWD